MTSRIERKLLHYTGKAIADYRMILPRERILVGLSGGKDSFAMVKLLKLLQMRAPQKFTLHVLAVDQGWPNWNRDEISAWLQQQQLSFTILPTQIAQVVTAKQCAKHSPCILCSRLRRGHIYTFAKQHGYHKVALGHHRDDLITSLLMSIFYNGRISSMPPKLIADDRQAIVIRPLAYCQERDLKSYAQEQLFPITPSGLCGLPQGGSRDTVKQWIDQLSTINPKIPSNILHALSEVRVSQLMDHHLWDFKNLESLLSPHPTDIT